MEERVTVKIELELINGQHFNPREKDLTPEQMHNEAMYSFIDWLDTWCGEADKRSLQEYIQVKVHE